MPNEAFTFYSLYLPGMTKTMKSAGSFLWLTLCSLTLNAQVQPGMKADEFKKIVPGIIPTKVYYDEDFEVAEKQQQFDGKWYLDFEHDSLKEVYYSAHLGSRPGIGYISSFDTLVKYYTQKMGKPAWVKMSADTVLSENRERKENMDSIRVVCWKTRYANVILGVYLTGNHKIKMTPQEKAAQSHVNAERHYNYYQFNVHVQKANHRGEAFSWELYPGLHVYKVVELKPNWFPNGVGLNGQWQKEEVFYGLSSNWSYTFNHSILKWMMWSYYAGKEDKETFEKCLKATQGIIEQYTQKYGTPVIVTGDLKYRDPNRKQHWGYDVLKATWDMKTYTIKVEYTFMGGKGQYDLLVMIKQELK